MEVGHWLDNSNNRGRKVTQQQSGLVDWFRFRGTKLKLLFREIDAYFLQKHLSLIEVDKVFLLISLLLFYSF